VAERRIGVRQILPIVLILAGAGAAGYQYMQLSGLQAQATTIQQQIDGIAQKKAADAAKATKVASDVTAACASISYATRTTVGPTLATLRSNAEFPTILAGMKTKCTDSAWAVDNLAKARTATAKSIRFPSCRPAGSTGTASGTLKNTTDRAIRVEFSIKFGASFSAKAVPAGTAKVVVASVAPGKTATWSGKAHLSKYAPDICRLGEVTIWPSASAK
jgi:cytochrome c2